MAAQPDRFRRHLPIAVLVLFQAIAFLLINLSLARAWPIADAATYLQQALALTLGGFPSDPARPILYPYLLSLAMKVTGFDLFRLLCFQGLALVLTTALLYRLALKLLGRKWAILAALLFVLFPDPYFQAASFYRETLAGLFLLALLNLIQVMLERPRELKWSFYAGVAAGLLTLIKPEFGSLMAVLALAGVYRHLRERDFRRLVAPWIICGITALAVVSPAILAARAHFGEWVFINTYKGFNWYCSYCGKMKGEGSFRQREDRRYTDANHYAVRVLFMSDPRVSFSERDGRLMREARACIADAPGRAAYLYFRRLLETMIRFDRIAPTVIGRGEAGHWPPWLVAALCYGNYVQDMIVLLLLGPGMWALRRRREALPLILVVIWFVLFYASVTYFNRFRLVIWPVMVLVALAGRQAIVEGERSKWARIGGGLWMVILAVGLLLPNVQTWSQLRRTITQREFKIGSGPAQEEKKVTLLVYASEFVVMDRFDLMEQWLGGYIRRRADRIDPATLLAAAGQTRERGMGRTAGFFYRMADEVAGREMSGGRIEELERSHLVVEMTAWTRHRSHGGKLYWDGTLPATPLGGGRNLPLEVRVNYGGRRLAFAGTSLMEAGPYSWSWSGRQMVVVLPEEAPAPGPEQPVKVDYFAEVSDQGLK